MGIVKCLMMQRDESTLLEPWLRYYGYLFGFENLTVFDNGSVLPDVIDILRRYERVGVDVYWDFAGRENFGGKGFHFTNVIKGWDFGGNYDFALPVDCDEFLAVLEPNRIDCSRGAIHRALDGLIGEKRTLGIEFSMFNIPGQPGCYRPQFYPKGFFAADTIKMLDHGYHYRVAQTEGRRETELTYVHYHYKPFALMVEHARRKLDGLTDLDHPDSAVGYTGSGNHLIQFLTMTEHAYHEQFRDSLMIRFDGLRSLLGALGTFDPQFHQADGGVGGARLLVRVAAEAGAEPRFAEFSAHRYLDAHPDVAAHQIEPLKHYFRHGFSEGRAIGSDIVDHSERMR